MVLDSQGRRSSGGIPIPLVPASHAARDRTRVVPYSSFQLHSSAGSFFYSPPAQLSGSHWPAIQQALLFLQPVSQGTSYPSQDSGEHAATAAASPAQFAQGRTDRRVGCVSLLKFVPHRTLSGVRDKALRPVGCLELDGMDGKLFHRWGTRRSDPVGSHVVECVDCLFARLEIPLA